MEVRPLGNAGIIRPTALPRRGLFFALLFALFITLSAFTAFIVDDRLITLTEATRNPFVLLAAIGLVIVICIVLSFCCLWAFNRLDMFHDSRAAHDLPSATDEFHPNTRAIRNNALILFFAWLIVFFIRFPGNTDPDTEIQLLQYYGLIPASNHHPWFDTILFGLFWDMGNAFGSNWWSVGLWALLQSMATATSLSLGLCYSRFLGAPERFVRVSLVFLACCPIFPMLAQTMAKDMLFGWLWVLFLLFFMESYRTNGYFLRNTAMFIVWTILLLFLVLTKKTAIYLIIFSCVLLIALRRNTVTHLLISLAIVTVFYFGLWNNFLLPSWGVQAGDDTREMMSIPAQQTALTIMKHGESFTEDDWKLLGTLYNDPQNLGVVYTPLRSDASKAQLLDDVPTVSILRYLQWVIGLAIRFPDTFFAAPLATAYPLFAVDPYVEFPGKEALCTVFLDEYTGIAPDGTEWIIAQWANWSGGLATYDQVKDVLSGAFRTPEQASLTSSMDAVYLTFSFWFAPLFSKAMWLTWVPGFVCAYEAYHRNRFALASLIPLMLIYATLLVGPIILTRYCTASIYSLPLITTLLVIPHPQDSQASRTL